MEVFVQQNPRRLVYIGTPSSRVFWEEHWNKPGLRAPAAGAASNYILKSLTLKYLARGARVLEAGCGRGENVIALAGLGFEAYGIDYAQKTVEHIRAARPGLNIIYGDVEKTPYADSFFDGYWSFGVIEHSLGGYRGIIAEASRILKKKGLLFLAFPALSPLRLIKARMGAYRKIRVIPRESFYQFALDCREVRSEVEKSGFGFKERRFWDACKGLKDEARLLKPLLQPVYDSRSPAARAARFLINRASSWFCGHIALLVFEKK